MRFSLISTFSLALVVGACSQPAPDTRPAIVVVVVDTLRADAVSSYGTTPGTTRAIDILAAQGLRYRHAYAPAGWTTPSHVSLFTGLGVDKHHIGVSDRMTTPDSLVTLAERLRDAGYETAGFAENALVGEPFGLHQGFERYDVQSIEQIIASFRNPTAPGFDLPRRVADWAAQRQPDKPFFLFVNIFDAHEPYHVRAENPFLPAGVTAEVARQTPHAVDLICDAVPPPADLAILRGLYLGDVAQADQKVARVRGAVTAAAGERQLIFVVTSDHGEHFGERRLLDHQFSLHAAAVHVPLVVAGLPVPPAVIDTPVTLMDVTASALNWAGLAVPSELDGRPLPRSAGEGEPRDLFAAFADRFASDMPDSFRTLPIKHPNEKRRTCGPQDRVFGDMASLIRWPYKLLWFERYPAELYDLSSDLDETHDLAATEPQRVAELTQAVRARIAAHGLFADATPAAIDPRAKEALRALGYDP